VVGNVVDMQSSTPVRDKFRTRLETNSRGQTEIYISHRGLTQVFKNDRHDQFAWETASAGAGQEVEYLRRLMVRLGSDEAKAAAQSAAAKRQRRAQAFEDRAHRATPVRWNWTILSIAPGAASAWRWTASASRSRTATAPKGLFYVRYADPDAVKNKKSEGMFNSIVKFFDQDKSVPAEQ